jgi:hypothetical protein
MDAARNDPTPEQAPVALIVLTAIVYVAGFAMVIAWFALVVLGPPAPSSAGKPLDPSACRVCGVVEGVAEFERASFQPIGEQSEGIVVLLAQLGGLQGAPAPGRVYETAVLHDDGTVRVVRDTRAPQWKRGDRVKVVRGRIEPLALAQQARY